MKRLTLAVAMLALLAAGCSDDDNNAVKPDMTSADFTTSGGGDTGAGCGTGIYPCGPYGTSVGDVVANMEFTGFFDAKHLCKKHKDEVMDTTTVRKLSFKDFFLGDSSCGNAKPKVLWVMVSAGWCGPCKYEVSTTQGWYTAGQVSDEIAVLNILFEDEKSLPTKDAFLKKWIADYKLTLPVLMDPSFKLGSFFDRKAVPFNMLIDTKTMKVAHRKTGADLTGIGKKALELANTL